MIIWSGFGFLPFVFLLAFAIVFNVDNKSPNYHSMLAYALLLAGLTSGALGWWLRKRPARIVVDKATGKEMAVRSRHAMFFIPMIYWGPIFIVIGLYQLVLALMKH